MRILFPVSEVTPVYQLGGLGDVARELPLALQTLGVDIRLCLPLHPDIAKQSHWQRIAKLVVPYAGKTETVFVWQAPLPDTQLPVYWLENAPYLGSPSGVADDAVEKFAFFSLTVAHAFHHNRIWQPDLIHLQDWHTGLIPVLLKHRYHTRTPKTLLTIHNLNFQGIMALDLLKKLGLNLHDCQILSWDQQNNHLNLLMEGLIHTDRINTVSPTYATEILTSTYGAQLEMVIQGLTGKLSGILNGIDHSKWNPETDPYLDHHYTTQSLSQGKSQNRIDLSASISLNALSTTPLFAYIGRIDPKQKGIDLMIDAITDGLLGTAKRPLVILGVGDLTYQNRLKALAQLNPTFVYIDRFDEPLAHQIYAAADFMLMPSQYEPCGLVQLIAMRYGTIPIVRLVGGLKDTVKPHYNGFGFEQYSLEAMAACITEACRLFKKPTAFKSLQSQAMAEDYSWVQSAKQYHCLYTDIVARP